MTERTQRFLLAVRFNSGNTGRDCAVSGEVRADLCAPAFATAHGGSAPCSPLERRRSQPAASLAGWVL